MKIKAKKMKIAILSVSFLVVLTIVSFYIYQFEIGSIVSAKTVYTQDVNVSANKIVVTGSTMNSALVYRNYESYLKDNNLYIKMRYVLAGSIINNKRTGFFSIEIEGDFNNLEEIYFEGAEATDLNSVWKKEK